MIDKTSAFIIKAKLVHGDKYNYSNVRYVKSTEKVAISCNEHGEFFQTPSNHLSGYGCPQCGKMNIGRHKKITTEQFIAKAKLVHGDKYDYSKTRYRSDREKVNITCPQHGDFEQIANAHLRGFGCAACGHRITSEKKTIGSREKFNESAKLVHGDKYDYSKVDYKNSSTHVVITCPQHGEFSVSPNNHLASRDCPKCANSATSKPETEIYEYVKSLVPDAEQSCRTLIAPQEVDIIVSSRKVAIEFNGLYWHSEKFRGKDYHTNKRKAVEAAGYRLISIREDVWRERKEHVKRIIRNALGLSAKGIYARKCNIAEVHRDVAKQFMLENHVQGFRGATHHYALMSGEDIQAVMSVTHWKRKDEWELVRYATTGNVVGGLSKLWKHVTRTHGVERAYSYVDRDLFTGSSYSNAGFTLASSSVGFRIVNGSNTESREKWNKAPEGLTQSQWYEREGVRRIYDSGQDKLIVDEPVREGYSSHIDNRRGTK